MPTNKLSIYFTPATPSPIEYRLKYWAIAAPGDITTLLVTSSPVEITGLTQCAYAGTLESICGGGVHSTVQSFAINTCTLPYTPCAYEGSIGALFPAQINVAPGVTDIAPGVTLYDYQNNIVTGIIRISDSLGVVYNVVNGVVTTPTGDQC